MEILFIVVGCLLAGFAIAHFIEWVSEAYHELFDDDDDDWPTGYVVC